MTEIPKTVINQLAQKRWSTDMWKPQEAGNIVLSNGTKILDDGRVVLSDNVTIMSANERWTAAMIIVKQKPEDPANSVFYGVYEIYQNRPLRQRIGEFLRSVRNAAFRAGGKS